LKSLSSGHSGGAVECRFRFVSEIRDEEKEDIAYRRP
jgi:hypothetical protein